MICIICRNETSKLYDKQFDLTYYKCDCCGFIAQDRTSLINHQEERDEYDRHENTIDNEGYVSFFKRFIESAVLPYAVLGQGLDYGSGPEPVLAQVMARDYKVAMDIYDLHYQPERIYEGKAYDYIVSTEVIEHVKDPVEILRLFLKLLKPGGVVGIMTLFHPEDDEAFLKWWYRRDITHISFFSRRTFVYMADLLGFDLIYSDDCRYVTLKKK